jgi:DNA-binding MarR family transcriptional regulator
MVAERAEDIRLAAWWKLMTASALLVQQVSRDLAEATALSLSSYNVLRLLQEAPGCRLRLSALARALILTRGGATRLANRLERAGVLRRQGDARDLRGSWAVLTNRGRDEWRRARQVFARTVAKHFGSHLTDEEAKILNAVLGRFATRETGADCQ